jgi:hypothetical protein
MHATINSSSFTGRSLTMSAVSSTFGAYQPMHSEDQLEIVGFS